MKKKLPKIGYWVFGTNKCPKDATAAVINDDGELVWYRGGTPEGRLKCDHCSGWNSENGGGYWWHNAREEMIYCDASDWQHGLVFRPKTRNTPSDKAKLLEM